MRNQSHRRRRRRRSSRARVATQPVRYSRTGQQFRLRSAEVLASLGVLVAAATLIALIWLVASGVIQAQRTDLRARVEVTVAGQSLVLADEIHREMLGVQQSLRILKAAFQADPDHFDMGAWREQMPALTDVTDDAFIADSQYIIRHDINPPEVGLRIGSRVAGMFGPETDTPDLADDPLAVPNMQKLQTRQHLSLMLLRLERPGGWVIGATYRTAALKRLFAEANLGLQGMTALIDTRLGRIQMVVGPAASNPNYDIAASAMYAAMRRRPDGTWVGPSAPDGVQRIHAFRPVPGHQLAVVVAVNETEAMRPAAGLAQDVRWLAIAATLVALAAMGIALYAVWTFRGKRRLRESLEREQRVVANAQAELAEARAWFGGRAGQLQALLASINEGALVLDAELRVVEWNQWFPAFFGVAPEVLQRGLPLDELLRIQVREGVFGALDDLESEVARRAILLRGSNESLPLLYAGPGGRTLAVFASRHADGSRLLMVRDPTEHDLRRAAEEPQEHVLEDSPATGAAETF
jgi:PAS domain-containing protein